MIEGDAVVHELELPVPPEQAFDMFTDASQLVRWIGISAELQARPGGRFPAAYPDEQPDQRLAVLHRRHDAHDR